MSRNRSFIGILLAVLLVLPAMASAGIRVRSRPHGKRHVVEVVRVTPNGVHAQIGPAEITYSVPPPRHCADGEVNLNGFTPTFYAKWRDRLSRQLIEEEWVGSGSIDTDGQPRVEMWIIPTRGLQIQQIEVDFARYHHTFDGFRPKPLPRRPGDEPRLGFQFHPKLSGEETGVIRITYINGQVLENEIYVQTLGARQ